MPRPRIFLKDSLFIIIAAELLIGLVWINLSAVGPYGYQQAAIKSMRGRLVHVMSGKHGYHQYVFKNIETGEFKRLHNLFTNAPNLVGAAKGHTVEFSYLSDQLLDCRVEGVSQCKPSCNSPSTCEARKMEVETWNAKEANILLPICIVSFLMIYGWRLRKNLKS